jgi:N-methylhydantoinase A/oxoprolinase/acetone carboxylase beta subunit
MQQLILKVREFLDIQGIRAPLMIVKGDGSLVNTSVALKRPVEIIMSGPAASVVGGLHLCQVKDALIIDIGSTTTDIAMVHNGYPALNPKGARVGGWQTMVETMDIHTTGLGGDSELHLDKAGNLIVGPRRMVPLSLLGVDYPAILDVLNQQLKRHLDGDVGRFVMRERPLETDQNNLTSNQQRIWELLGNGPVPITHLFDGVEIPWHFKYALDGLIEQGLVAVSAFTPTDAVHMLGQYCNGSVEAAILGAELWSQQLGINKEEFCKKVVEQVIIQVGQAVIESTLAGEDGVSFGGRDNVGRLFINRALGNDDSGNFKVTLSLRNSLVGIGAPADTYLTPLVGRLNTQLHIPEHAGVANAIGAVAGGVVQKVRILIRQPWGEDGGYRVYLPFGVRDFQQLADAANHAQKTARRLARRRAIVAGASKVRIFIERNDQIVPIANDYLYLGTEVMATAVGRPQPIG